MPDSRGRIGNDGDNSGDPINDRRRRQSDFGQPALATIVRFVKSLLPIALFALAGVLVGGAWSMHRQGASRGGITLVCVLAVLAVTGGVLWLIPGGGG